MGKDTNKPKVVDMRRRDRAVHDAEWIGDFLDRAPVCVIATSVDNEPVANTNTFVYDRNGHAIYWHTARESTLRNRITANPAVCLTAFEMGRLLPADIAAEFSLEFESVVAYGDARLVNDDEEGMCAMRLLMTKYFGHLREGTDYGALSPSQLQPTTIYRLDIDRWSGKRKQERPGFPGAFRYPLPANDEGQNSGD